MKKIEVVINGSSVPMGPFNPLFMNQGIREFNTHEIYGDSLSEKALLSVLLNYELEYDSLPATKLRTSSKNMTVRIPPANGGNITFSVSKENEE